MHTTDRSFTFFLLSCALSSFFNAFQKSVSNAFSSSAPLLLDAFSLFLICHLGKVNSISLLCLKLGKERGSFEGGRIEAKLKVPQ
jgi:hypothetical protein